MANTVIEIESRRIEEGKKEVVVLGKAPKMETWKGNFMYIHLYSYLQDSGRDEEKVGLS